MTWRKKREPAPQPVSVNAKLLRLSSDDLVLLAESSLITASEATSRMQASGDDRSFWLDIAQVHTRQANEALALLGERWSSS